MASFFVALLGMLFCTVHAGQPSTPTYSEEIISSSSANQETTAKQLVASIGINTTKAAVGFGVRPRQRRQQQENVTNLSEEVHQWGTEMSYDARRKKYSLVVAERVYVVPGVVKPETLRVSVLLPNDPWYLASLPRVRRDTRSYFFYLFILLI
jgi:hypothetical protein